MHRYAIAGRRGRSADVSSIEIRRESFGCSSWELTHDTRGRFDVLLRREMDSTCTRSSVGAEKEGKNGAGEGDGAGDETGEEVRVFEKEGRVAEEEGEVLDGVFE